MTHPYVQSSRDLALAQTRRGSFYEAAINIAIGFTINFAANLLVFPLFDMHIGLLDNLWMGCIYTVISVVRSYVVRRWFNARLKLAALHLAGAAR